MLATGADFAALLMLGIGFAILFVSIIVVAFLDFREQRREQRHYHPPRPPGRREP